MNIIDEIREAAQWAEANGGSIYQELQDIADRLAASGRWCRCREYAN